ncbi:hypothetical protein [Variovorax sp. W6]|uniref:hypothetical protein n=1 Tax=Variovorax sp. W6 TaxID=3093895 RepID=UPI003D8061D9
MFDLSPIKSDLTVLFASLGVHQVQSKYLKSDGFTGEERKIGFQSGNVQTPDGVHTKGELFVLLDAISAISVGSKHRDVLDNAAWRTMYGFQDNVAFPAFNELGHGTHAYEPAMPCHNCGIVLPVFALEIDHRHAQVDDARQAMIKMMRALGHTSQGPSGHKGRYLLNPTTVQPTFIAPKRGLRGARSIWDAVAKSTISKPAESLIWCIGALSEANQKKFINACKNSLTNLRPMCRKCNGEKSNEWLPLFTYR